jgi:hypothetical protein
MSAAKLVVFTMVCFSVHAHAQTQTLAVYSSRTSALDSRIQNSLDQELTRLLAPAGLQIAWRETTQGQREELGRLVVGKFVGSCSVDSLPLRPIATTKTVTLAASSMSDARILPYFTVDCPSVIQTISPTLQHLSVPSRDTVLGRALARVIAHEIYHILANTADHEESGLSKPQLSLSDLTTNRFVLSPESLQKIRASIQPMSSVPIASLLSIRAIPN